MSRNGYGYRRSWSPLGWLMDGGLGRFFLVGVLVIFIGYCIFGVIFYQNRTVTATICSKERTATSGGGEYRVYTADKGTFVLKDMHWIFGDWRTNTADVYGRLHVPGTYKISYVGFRFSLFSWFPNIASYERLPDNKSEIAKC